jgi:thiol:disulfide interchange protein DsbD
MTAPAAAAGPQTAEAGPGVPIEAWSPDRVAALRAEGRPVFVDFTAAWCVTCQVNERTALAGKRVADAFEKTGAVYLKADWTNRNDDIAKELAGHGRSGVPLYLVYGATGEPVILPQLLTEGSVAAALEKAKAG